MMMVLTRVAHLSVVFGMALADENFLARRAHGSNSSSAAAEFNVGAPGDSGVPRTFGPFELRWAGQANTCMDVAGGSHKNFNKIQVWACDHPENQRFYFHSVEAFSTNGQLRWARDTSKCLDVKDGNTHNFADVVLHDCHAKGHPDFDHQVFKVDYFAPVVTFNPTTIMFKNKCVDLDNGVVGSPSQPKSKVIIYECHPEGKRDWINQQWNVIMTEDSTTTDSMPDVPRTFGPFELQWAGQANTCMDVAGGSDKNFNKIQVWACDHPENQRFYFHSVEAFSTNGQLRWARDTSKCLDVKDGNTHNFADVVLYDCHAKGHSDFDHQVFKVDYFAPVVTSNPTTIMFKNKCVDLDNGVVGSPSQPKSKVITYDCHPEGNQDWINQQWNVIENQG